MKGFTSGIREKETLWGDSSHSRSLGTQTSCEPPQTIYSDDPATPDHLEISDCKKPWLNPRRYLEDHWRNPRRPWRLCARVPREYKNTPTDKTTV